MSHHYLLNACDSPRSQIIGPLWGGNEWAGMMCIVNGFTHIMCVAEELPDPVGDFEGRCFCRAPFIQGTKNPLHREAYKRAVIWIKRSMRDGYKVGLEFTNE